MALIFRTLFLLLFLPLLLPAQTVPTVRSTSIRWFGQGFIYVTSVVGIRVALDPFGEESVDYPFPPRLQADVVLISNEADESSATDKIFGSPQIFRSETAVGLNKARGTLFKGVQTYLDNQRGNQLGFNTCFSFELDGIKFVHLGFIGHPLSSEQVSQLGHADVLFLPVGNPAVSVEAMRKMAVDLDAKVIIPISYATIYNKKLTLRKIDDFLNGASNVQQLDNNELMISRKTLPSVSTIYVLKSST